MDELGPDEQRWLDALRGEGEPDHADRARVRASVLATLAAGTGATTAVGAGLGKAAGIAKAASGTATLFAPWKIGVAVASLALVGGGITAVAVRSAKTAAPSTAVSVSVARATTSTALPPPLSPTKAGAPAESAESAGSPAIGASPAIAGIASSRPERHASARPRSTSSSSHARESDVDAELVLLTEAQQALKRGDANAALAALGRHAHEHSRGALAVEREGLRAIASCEAKREGGRALAERFVAQNPSSPLVARVRTACLSP